MKRNSPVWIEKEESAFITPEQRLWVERASDFSACEPDAEDWSFLSHFSPDSESIEELEKGEQQEAP